MKKSIYMIAIVAYTTATIFTSCGSSQQKVDAAKADIESAEMDLMKAKEDYNKEYNEFKYKSEKQIADNAERINVLKKQAEKIKKELKEEYEKTIADLEAKNNVLQSKIDEAKEGSDEGWESFKREFSHDMEELGKAISEIGTNDVN